MARAQCGETMFLAQERKIVVVTAFEVKLLIQVSGGNGSKMNIGDKKGFTFTFSGFDKGVDGLKETDVHFAQTLAALGDIARQETKL